MTSSFFQHACQSIRVGSFEPKNCNSLTLNIVTETGEFDLVLFGLPDCEIAKFVGFGKPDYGPSLPVSKKIEAA